MTHELLCGQPGQVPCALRARKDLECPDRGSVYTVVTPTLESHIHGTGRAPLSPGALGPIPQRLAGGLEALVVGPSQHLTT